MKMEFVDEAELQKAADEPEDEVRGRIVLVGEPMGLFIAEELGELENVTHFSAAVAGAEYNVGGGTFPPCTMKRCTARASATTGGNAFKSQ